MPPLPKNATLYITTEMLRQIYCTMMERSCQVFERNML
nr:MAG TPA: hypothetical protein [Caudoviricetes sp.]